jgi:hypothetical protein
VTKAAPEPVQDADRHHRGQRAGGWEGMSVLMAVGTSRPRSAASDPERVHSRQEGRHEHCFGVAGISMAPQRMTIVSTTAR